MITCKLFFTSLESFPQIKEQYLHFHLLLGHRALKQTELQLRACLYTQSELVMGFKQLHLTITKTMAVCVLIADSFTSDCTKVYTQQLFLYPPETSKKGLLILTTGIFLL